HVGEHRERGEHEGPRVLGRGAGRLLHRTAAGEGRERGHEEGGERTGARGPTASPPVFVAGSARRSHAWIVCPGMTAFQTSAWRTIRAVGMTRPRPPAGDRGRARSRPV